MSSHNRQAAAWLGMTDEEHCHDLGGRRSPAAIQVPPINCNDVVRN
jgi:hypothetical protein